MSAMNEICVPDAIRRKIVNLTELSHRSHMDLNTAVPWFEGVDQAISPKRPETSWIYGTPVWETLTPAQRHELFWMENARDVSMFIWLEQTLPPLYMGYINRHGHLLPDYLKDYLLVFSGEEIVHIQVFRRYMEMTGLNLFNPPEGLHELFVERLPAMPPIMGMLSTLLVEWVAENAAQHGTASDQVERLTQRMFREHHREELRHITFARWVIESLVAGSSPAVRAGLREFTEGFMGRLIPQFTFNQDIVSALSFGLGFTGEDVAAIDALRNSPNNLRMNGERFGPIFQWLRKTGLVDPEFTVPGMPVGPATNGIWHPVEGTR
jgi:hypothetical protein